MFSSAETLEAGLALANLISLSRERGISSTTRNHVMCGLPSEKRKKKFFRTIRRRCICVSPNNFFLGRLEWADQRNLTENLYLFVKVLNPHSGGYGKLYLRSYDAM